tara:strand:+ start:1414 stop:1611 length:198 start_codon:yes stop_codon:yes gene_type:complete
MPPKALGQPACAAPITPLSVSASSTGTQSAVKTPNARCGVIVTSASAAGASGNASVTTATSVPCT